MYTVKIVCFDDLRCTWLKTLHKIGDIIEISDNKLVAMSHNVKVLNKFVYNTKKHKCKCCNKTYIKQYKYVIEDYSKCKNNK
jgi:hypothetical protein